MYTKYFGFHEKPFTLTPNPRFIFLSKNHKEAFAHLLYGINNHYGFIELTGEERFTQLGQQPLIGFAPEEREQVTSVLGWRLQNEIYRQILLGVISEQWVEYLTKVEALRVSIGLEAYAQRNPLVEYKGKASELFRALLRDVRVGAISRMFTTQPRRGSEASVEQRSAESSEADASAVEALPPAFDAAQRPAVQEHGKKKRRRH